MSPSNVDHLGDYRSLIGTPVGNSAEIKQCPEMRLSFYTEIAPNAFWLCYCIPVVGRGCFALFLHSCFAERLADFTLLSVHHMEQSNFCAHKSRPPWSTQCSDGEAGHPSTAGLEDTGTYGVRLAFISFAL